MTDSFSAYAVVVAVNRNTDTGLEDLGEDVRRDGDLVEKVLLDEDVCGYGSERVTRLVGASASFDQVIGSLESLRTTVNVEDPVFLYFSGHGDAASCDGSEGASLFPFDADIGNCRNVLTSRVLRSVWGRIPSKRKLAVVDACYSGGLRITKSMSGAEKRLSGPQLAALSEGEGAVLISSSRASETSLILQGDSTSLFTKHLVNGLFGWGGHDRDGYVRVFDLFNYVAIQVRQEAPGQSPVYAAYHRDRNFAVAYCKDGSRRRAAKSKISGSGSPRTARAMTELFCELYPLGPRDQAIWERAGGDLSRLALSGQGRTDWFRACQVMDRGGMVTVEMICQEALLDFPRNRDIERLRQSSSEER